MYNTATIAAVATAPGPGAIGIVRVSGSKCAEIVRRVAERLPVPRYASLQKMYDLQHQPIDRGLVLYFPAPASYTGEDMVEFHTHGGPIVLARMLQAIYAAGAEPARPGEFTQRAFLNGKIDLLQAEAVADLITSSTERSLRAANLAISGRFSTAINVISQALVEARSLLEATIDFGDELSVNQDTPLLYESTQTLRIEIQALLKNARQGAQLARGLRVVLIGRPNSGKSTLLNALSGHNRAIVSDKPGTTRDILLTEVDIEGLLVTFLDTAGLHDTLEEIEREGIRRAMQEVATADLIFCVYDATEPRPEMADLLTPDQIYPSAIIYVRNKIDRLGENPAVHLAGEYTEVSISAKEGTGIEALRAALLKVMAIDTDSDSPLLARARHLNALRIALEMLEFSTPIEFWRDPVESAERLRIAHQALGELTGEFTNEDMLGEIFSRFCIGK